MIKKIEEDRALWELFTKKEEYDSILLDKYGGFSYNFSSQRSVFEPEVSDFLIKNELSPEYPEERKFAVCLTLDIDFVCPRMLNTAARNPFNLYSLNTGKEIDILEIPLSIMDTTLFSQMHLDINQAWKLTEKLIDTVERHKSVLMVLWQNTYMQGDYLEFYRKILQYSTQKGAWTVSGAEIYKWWKKDIENYCAG